MDEAKVVSNFEEAEAMLREAEAEQAAAREVTRIEDADTPDFGAPDLKNPPPSKAGSLEDELKALEKNAQETKISEKTAEAAEER